MAEETIHRDIFPAEVLLPDGEFVRKCRVIVTGSHLHIYRWLGDIDEQVYTLRETVPKNKASLPLHMKEEIQLDEGTVIINRAMGCRCGPLGYMKAPFNW